MGKRKKEQEIPILFRILVNCLVELDPTKQISVERPANTSSAFFKVVFAACFAALVLFRFSRY